MLYNKVCDIVSNISELLEIQLLTDTTILQVTISKTEKIGYVSCINFLHFGINFPGFFYGYHSILCGECQ